jgi:hypothetical protein
MAKEAVEKALRQTIKTLSSLSKIPLFKAAELKG